MLKQFLCSGGHYIMLEHLTTILLARPLSKNFDFEIGRVLDLAVKEGGYHITKLLLQKSQYVPWRVDWDEVHILTERNDHHMLKLLVENNRLSYATKRDYYDPSPIHVAASKGYVECIKILLAVGYTPLETYNRNEFTISTPIDEAMIHCQLEVLKLFKNHPAIGEEKQRITQYLSDFSYE